MLRYALLLCVLLITRFCNAQLPLLKHYTVDDGLPSNNVYSFFQDSKGFIWICTDLGVSRFDGTKFETFTSNDGLPDNEIFGIKEDPWHRCWIINYNKRPAYIYNGKVYNSQNDSLCRTIRDRQIKYNEFFLDAYGGFHILADGIYTVKKNTIARSSFSAQPKSVLYRFDYLGVAYALTWEGIYRADGYSWTDTKVIETALISARLFLKGHLYCYNVKDYPGKRSAGLFYDIKFDAGKPFVRETKVPYRILNFISGKNEQLWFCTDNGVYAYDPAKAEVANNNLVALKGTVVHDALIDKQGNSWFATAEGVYCQSENTALIFNKQSGLKKDDVRSISHMPDGKLLAGYNNGVVDIIDGQGIRSFKLSKDRLNRVIYLVPIDKNHFFAGSDRGLYRINIKANTSTTINNYCQKAGALRNNLFVHGFRGDLNGSGGLIDLATHKTRSLPFKADINRIVATAIDARGKCWLGTLDGLYYLQDDQINLFDSDSILLHSHITSLAVSDAGQVIVATSTDGIFIIDGFRVYRIHKANGLISNISRKVLLDAKGRIWVVTDKGLDRITLLENNRVSIYHFSTADGIPNYIINDLTFGSGKAYLATPKGIVVIDQDQRSGSIPFRTYILSAKVKDSVFHFPEKITLDYKQNSIQVNYTAISYTEGSGITYKYLLKGASADTIKTKECVLSLGALSPGHYILMVWSAGKNDNWNKIPALLDITVNPPFWNKAWFLTGIACLLLAGLFLMYQFRVKHVRKKEKEKAARKRTIAELEMQALRAQINPHFMFNALNAIQNYYNQNDELSANYYMSSFARLIRQTLNYSKEHWIKISDEMAMLKTYIELEQMRFKNAFTYAMHVEPGIEHYEVPTMLLQAYTDNAINHGLRALPEKTGKLTISCSTRDGAIICTIEDNGVGFEKARVLDSRPADYKSMGMKITAGRIGIVNELYGTSIKVNIIDRHTLDKNTQGTIIEIIIQE